MMFQLFGIDCFIKEKLFGFWLCSIQDQNQDFCKSLLSIYYDDGLLSIDLCGMHFTI